MSCSIHEAIHASIDDVEARLKKIGPPAVTEKYGEVELLPKFFDGMPRFDASLFSYDGQQIVTALSYIPIIKFKDSWQIAYTRNFQFNFSGPHYSGFSRYPANEWMECRGCADYMSEEDMEKWLFQLDSHNLTEPAFDNRMSLVIGNVHEAYKRLLNKNRLNRLDSPDSFTSLQLYTFFKSSSKVKLAVEGSAHQLMDRIVQSVQCLDEQQKTSENIAQVVSQQTGLTLDGNGVKNFLNNWELARYFGGSICEKDFRLVAVFMEVLDQCGHLGGQAINNAMDKLCYERGVPGIKTPGVVSRVMREILGLGQYNALLDKAKLRHISDKQPLITVKPIRPDMIQSVNMRSAEVRQLIEEETLGTGERDSSSIRHGTLYNNPAVRQRNLDGLDKK